MSTIILTGGGTAGHCLPNIALLPTLKKNFDKIYYVGSKTGIEKNIALKNNLKYYEVSTAKLKRKITFSNLKIPIELIRGINQAKRIIKETSPDIIFSKGGYVSIPMVIAGFMCKIPVITHESDLTVGLANKIASNFSHDEMLCFHGTTIFGAKNIILSNSISSGANRFGRTTSYDPPGKISATNIDTIETSVGLYMRLNDNYCYPSAHYKPPICAPSECLMNSILCIANFHNAPYILDCGNSRRK